jgi:hypothetical protein
MSRSSFTFDKKDAKKKLSPWWRGVGCVMLVIIFAASFAASSWFLDRVTDPDPNARLKLPGQLAVMHGGLNELQRQFRTQFPWFGLGKYVAPAALSVVVAMFSYGVIEALYAFARGDINDPRDERKWKPDSRRTRNVRKCR